MNYIDLRIGLKLKAIREHLKLSQADLAKKLNVKQNTISHWENGKYGLKARQIYEIGLILKINPWVLIPVPGEKKGMNIVFTKRDHK